MRRWVVPFSLLVLHATTVSAQPVVLPLPVRVVDVLLSGCDRVTQSSTSCALDPSGSGPVSGTAIVSNPAGVVEVNIAGNISIADLPVGAETNIIALADVTLEIVVPPNTVRVAMSVSASGPSVAGVSRVEAEAVFEQNESNTSALFGGPFVLAEGQPVRISSPALGHRGRVRVLPEFAPGDTVRLRAVTSLRAIVPGVPDGNSVTFNETSVWEFSYVPAPEPPAESGLGAGIAAVLALGARRRGRRGWRRFASVAKTVSVRLRALFSRARAMPDGDV